MSKTKTFTGRERYRLLTRWFRRPLLGLQRYWRYKGIEEDTCGPYPYDRPYDFTLWKDAQVQDDIFDGGAKA